MCGNPPQHLRRVRFAMVASARRSKRTFVAAFLAPAAAIYAVFVIWPLMQTFWLSLFKYKGLSANKTFNAPDNYTWLLKEPVFLETLKHNLFLLLVGGLVIMSLSLLIAHAMQGGGWLSRSLRSIFLFPQVISIVVVAVIWQFVYNPSSGLLNAGLDAAGLDHMKTQWIAQKSTALGAVTTTFVWWALGFYVMLFSAGLGAISHEVGEAAQLDGAHGWKRFWKVTWPMLWSVRRIAVTYLISNVLNVFALVFVMTQGGPDRATETMLTFLYQVGFEQSSYGKASAIAVVSFGFALLLCGAAFGLMRKDPEGAT